MLIRNSSSNFQSTTQFRKVYNRKKLKQMSFDEVAEIAKENGIRVGTKSKMRLIDEIANYSNCF